MSLATPLNVVVVDLEVLGMREFIDSLDGCTVGLPAFDYWDKPQTRIYNGVEVKGRETRGYGDHSFRYAGKNMDPSPWESNEDVAWFKKVAEHHASEELGRNVEFTFCLCGLYKTGEDSIPHHSDTVPTRDDVVFSISLGAARVFEWNQYQYFIKKKTNTSKINIIWPSGSYLTKERYIMGHGQAILFDGHSQMTSTHAVPPVLNSGERINLTFRSGL